MSETLTKEVYLVLSRNSRTFGKPLNRPELRTQKPSLKRGEIAVRLQLQVPVRLFETFIPSGTLTIPTDMADLAPVEVEVPEDIREPSEVRFRLVPITPDDEDHE